MYKNNKLEYGSQLGIMNLNYLMDHILSQIFKVIWNILSKKREKLTDNSPIEIYIIFYIIYNKIEITRNLSKKNIFSETFNSQFLHIEVWFTYKNAKPLEKEDKLN